MDIRTASGTVNSTNLITASSMNKLSVPVSPAMSPYAQFKYVRGIPAFNAQRAVPVSKLTVLNNLIDSLQQFKSQRNALQTKQEGDISDEALNAMIKQYSQQLHQVLKQSTPSFGGQASATGMAFNVAV